MSYSSPWFMSEPEHSDIVTVNVFYQACGHIEEDTMEERYLGAPVPDRPYTYYSTGVHLCSTCLEAHTREEHA